MNRVKSSDRLSAKRVSRAVNDVRAYSEDVPMRSRCVQVSAAIGRRALLELSKSHCADEHAIALEQCEIGGDHELRLAEDLAHARRRPLHPATKPAPRSTRHRPSSDAPFLVEKLRRA